MLVKLLMIIMAIIAASGFVGLGVSFLGRRLQVEEEEEEAGEHKGATAAGWPAG